MPYPDHFIDTLSATAARAANYLEQTGERRVTPAQEALDRLPSLGGTLPDAPATSDEILALLDEIAAPATVTSAGGRYFGFVVGGTLPGALVASWLTSTWDQNCGFRVMSPATAQMESIALEWVIDCLGLPAGSQGGLVTGCTMANVSAIAAARCTLLERLGWDVVSKGLYGAPEIKVVVGDEVHASVLKALSLIGFGRDRVVRVPVDGQGRMRSAALPTLNEATLLCIQAGNVNTGAFDPAEEICPIARDAGAWVHVDGAFGLWAHASPRYRHLVRGFERADSWATDAHKWPNVGYDSGLVIVKNPEHLWAAMNVTAAYFPQEACREPCQFTPEFSRRARGVELWAALRSLGRQGLADLIERTCRHAKRFAESLADAGYRILNDVVINQVLVSFGSAERTRAVIKQVQEGGTCWCGETTWQGNVAMRISVSSWATTDDDVEISLAAMKRAANAVY
ncbi:MAG: aminotransferase class V-fold PLP-dependent enzyme [Bryobacteraceae bacterium]